MYPEIELIWILRALQVSCPGYVHTNGYLAPLRTACRRQEPQRDGEAARTFTVRAHTSPRSGPRVVEQALP